MPQLSISGLVVVSLFVNGQELALPNPAFVHEGRVYAPLRALLEKTGATVKWEAATQRATVKHGERTVTLTVGERTMEADGALKALDTPPLRIRGVLYVPLRATIDIFGATIGWDAIRRAASIKYEDPRAPEPVTVAMLRADPCNYELTPVALTGEYRGWTPDPFSPETRHGPPETRSDWILRDETGDIYCTSASECESDLPLGPLADVGRRIRVEGVGAIARAGFAYVRPKKVSTVGGPEGLTCVLSAGKQLYQRGEAVHMTLTLRNPFDAEVAIPADGAPTIDFFVTNAAGAQLWRRTADARAAKLTAPASLAAGEEKVYEASWNQTANAPAGDRAAAGGAVEVPGVFSLSARIGNLTTYPTRIRIVQASRP